MKIGTSRASRRSSSARTSRKRGARDEAADIAPFTFAGDWQTMVFVNGKLDARLSSIDAGTGYYAGSLRARCRMTRARVWWSDTSADSPARRGTRSLS